MDEFRRTELFYSIVDGDEDLFLKLLNLQNDINQPDKNGMTLLHFAAEYGRVSMATKLIELGIDIDAKDSYGNTALWKATFNSRGNYELVKLLIDNNANPNSYNNANRSPVILAETMGNEELLNILNQNSG